MRPALRGTDFAGGQALLTPGGGTDPRPVQAKGAAGAKAPAKGLPALPDQLDSNQLGDGQAVARTFVRTEKVAAVIKLAANAELPPAFLQSWASAKRAVEADKASLGPTLLHDARRMLGELEQWLGTLSADRQRYAASKQIAFTRVTPALSALQTDAAGTWLPGQLAKRAAPQLERVLGGVLDLLSGTPGLAARMDQTQKDLTAHAAGASYTATVKGRLSDAASANAADLASAPAKARAPLQRALANALPVTFMYTEKGGQAHLYLVGVSGPTRLLQSMAAGSACGTEARRRRFETLLDRFRADNAWLPKGKLSVALDGVAIERQIAVTSWWRQVHDWLNKGDGTWLNHVLFWAGVVGMVLATGGAGAAAVGGALLSTSALAGTAVTALDLYVKARDQSLTVKDGLVGLATVIGYLTGASTRLLTTQTKLLARAETALQSAERVPWWVVSRLSRSSLAMGQRVTDFNNWVTLTIGRGGYLLTLPDVIEQGRRLLAEKKYAQFMYHMMVSAVGHGMYVIGNKQAFKALRTRKDDLALLQGRLAAVHQPISIDGVSFPVAKVATAVQKLQSRVATAARGGKTLSSLTRIQAIDGVPVRVVVGGGKALTAQQLQAQGIKGVKAGKAHSVRVFLGRHREAGEFRVIVGGGASGRQRILSSKLETAPTPGELVGRAVAARDVPAGDHGAGTVIATNKQHASAGEPHGAAHGKGKGKGDTKAKKQAPAANNKNAGLGGADAAKAAQRPKTLDEALNGHDADAKRLGHLVTAYAHKRRLLAQGIASMLGRVRVELSPSYVRPTMTLVAHTKLGALPAARLSQLLKTTLALPANAHLGQAPKPWPAQLFELGTQGVDALVAHVRARSTPSAVWTEVVGPDGLATASPASVYAVEQAMLGFAVGDRYQGLQRAVILEAAMHGRPFAQLLPH
ncbi:MAG: hypothetical protein EP329_04135 [Deltaproteobacteria bacterium]|nr:MAG: hypothetical protein EP329_04135 [Deltaproteobacteria bacterium]